MVLDRLAVPLVTAEGVVEIEHPRFDQRAA